MRSLNEWGVRYEVATYFSHFDEAEKIYRDVDRRVLSE